MLILSGWTIALPKASAISVTILKPDHKPEYLDISYAYLPKSKISCTLPG